MKAQFRRRWRSSWLRGSISFTDSTSPNLLNILNNIFSVTSGDKFPTYRLLTNVNNSGALSYTPLLYTPINSGFTSSFFSRSYYAMAKRGFFARNFFWSNSKLLSMTFFEDVPCPAWYRPLYYIFNNYN